MNHGATTGAILIGLPGCRVLVEGNTNHDFGTAGAYVGSVVATDSSKPGVTPQEGVFIGTTGNVSCRFPVRVQAP
jgi:hypothetical protein